jgi:hypothetical protein
VDRLYSVGRDLAVDLSHDLADVANLVRFPRLSNFIGYLENIIATAPTLAPIADACEQQLHAHPDYEVNSWSIRHMIALYRNQLALIDTITDDIVALKRSKRYVNEQHLEADVDLQDKSGSAFYRVGNVWQIAFGTRATQLTDSDGLRYIAFLLRRPHQDVHVTSLRDVATKQHKPDAHNRAADLNDEANADRLSMAPSRQNVSDRRGLRGFNIRLNEIDSELNQALADNDESRIPQLRSEREHIVDLLSESVRAFRDTDDNLRTTVQKSISRARKQIGTEIPELEQHLHQCLRTGFTCRYDPPVPIKWVLDSAEAVKRPKHPRR